MLALITSLRLLFVRIALLVRYFLPADRPNSRCKRGMTDIVVDLLELVLISRDYDLRTPLVVCEQRC